LYNAGIEKLEYFRGFSTYEKTKYRNIPEWQIAIELQNKFPFALIIDPSLLLVIENDSLKLRKP
jgi:chorismate mutase